MKGGTGQIGAMLTVCTSFREATRPDANNAADGDG